MRTIYGEGPEPCDLMLVGERPGWEETRENRPFVGPAGTELWDRFAHVDLPDRDAWYVTNTVKTFSKEPPTTEETLLWRPLLRDELAKVKPRLVVTVGAYALRWFLGEDAEIDKCHGLLFIDPFRGCYVYPMYHSSAALRQPELYQQDFHRDCVGLVPIVNDLRSKRIATHVRQHAEPTVAVYDCRTMTATSETRLAKIAKGEILGLDLEGSIEEPQCLTVADRYASFLVGADQTALAEQTVELARRFVMHNAVRDLRACQSLGLDLDAFDDLQLGAYLLDEPQALKTLAFRECGLEMKDYADLVAPIDENACRQTLLAARERYRAESQSWELRWKSAREAAKATRNKTKKYLTKRRERREKKAFAPSKRCLTSLTKMLDKPAEQPLRKRWSNSTFAERVPLPPEPTWADVPPEIAVPYACHDAFGHYTTWTDRIKPRLKREGLWECYRMDRAVLPMLARMESVGMKVDADALRGLDRELETEYEQVCDRIEDMLGYRLNPKAAEDVSEALFDELGVTPTKLTKSGRHYTTGDKYLEARKKEHELIPLLIQGRELWKLKSSYATKLPGMLDRQSRYHPEFGYTRTASGRLSETIILLIPKHSAFGKKIRNAFVADDDHALVSCDLSQIELRVLAHVSGDRELRDVFRQGRDPHAETAHRMLGAPKRKEDQDESKHRLPSKKLNFGMFMGLSELGLTEQIRAGGNPEWAKGCPHCDFTGSDTRDRPDHADDCESRVAQREYFKLYKGVKRYIAARHEEARQTGVVRDMWGRKIYVAGIWSSNRGIVRRFERMAQATPIQAGADGISKRWNARLWDWLVGEQTGGRYLEPWTRTHDDTVLETDFRIADGVKKKMLALVPQDLCIPVLADGKIGRSWGELKG